MKKIHLLSFVMAALSITGAFAESFTITISGFTYSPATLNVVVGDEITIVGSEGHPLIQVSEASWNANSSTPLPGGFGPETSAFTFTVTEVDVIYFGCANHIGSGMKGMITVSTPTGVSNLSSGSALRVFPSISTGEFNVKGGQELLDGTTLDLYNTAGQLVESFELEGVSMQLRANVATGTYSAIIRKGDQALLKERMVFITED